MRQVLASRTVVSGADKQPVGPPPSPEEIADRFPQFEILECLGRGGMGVVYKARQKSLNRLVAIKILAPERGHESRFAERFAREAELLAKLNHPHIVTIHDFGETDGLFYLVMEFVDGVNLRDLLREGKLEPKQALAIVPPICEALQYAHDKGIVHRDIKPENLLLDREGRIKIADFGIAALMGTEGEEAGTPPYMAPEQSGRSSGIDHRADLYALGVVLYEMLTGERPTTDLVAPSRKVQIDVRLDEMVLRALEKTPELRYQTAAEFRTVVETLAAPAVEQEAANRERRKKRKKKVVFSLPDPLPSKSALLGIAFAAIGSGVLLFVFRAEAREWIHRCFANATQVIPALGARSSKAEGGKVVESEAQRIIDAEKVIRDANEYLDLVLSQADAIRAGMGDQHPNVIANRNALERFRETHPDLSRTILRKLAGERLAKLKEERARIQDDGLGNTHPMVLGVTARIEAMEAVIGADQR